MRQIWTCLLNRQTPSAREPRRQPTAGLWRRVTHISLSAAVLLCALTDTDVLRAEEPPREEFLEEPEPPPISVDEMHFGVAVAFEPVLSPGDVCPADAETPCIFGSGGGLAVRFGYRSRGAWFVAGAYEFSRHDASNLLRLPILQQLRAEVRRYFDQGKRLTPYATATLGAMAYGDEWGIETGGIAGGLGAGVEFEVSRTAVVGAAIVYRPLAFRRWRDSAGQLRADGYLGFGFAHLIGLELILALRDPLPRW